LLPCDYHGAVESYLKCLAVAREIGDRRGEGGSLGNLGLAYFGLGEYQLAVQFNQQHLAIAREIGDRRGESSALFNASQVLEELGKRTEAIRCAEEALTIYQQIESPHAEIVQKLLAEWRKSG